MVFKVIDGDTLRVIFQDKEESLRLIDTDCPESPINPKAQKDAQKSGQDIKTIIEMGKRGTAFRKSLVKKGDRVGIEFDVQQTDRRGRLLGYVYISDGWMLNEEIVKAGYASPLAIPPNIKYLERFLKATYEAKEGKRGLWR